MLGGDKQRFKEQLLDDLVKHRSRYFLTFHGISWAHALLRTLSPTSRAPEERGTRGFQPTRLEPRTARPIGTKQAAERQVKAVVMKPRQVLQSVKPVA